MNTISNNPNQVKDNLNLKDFLTKIRVILLKLGVIRQEDNYSFSEFFRDLEKKDGPHIQKLLEEWRKEEAEKYVISKVEDWYFSREQGINKKVKDVIKNVQDVIES